jgi:hypothetical protein
MRLTVKQTEAYDLAHEGSKQVILYGGAIRGGKTYWLLLTYISFCSKYPKSRWVIVRESRPTLERNTIQTFNKLLDEGLINHIKDYNHQSLTVTFNNESKILFMAESYDDDKELNRFRGLEINGAGVDELNEINQATFYKLIERSGSWTGAVGKPPISILATCNPSHNWVKEKFYTPYLEGRLPEKWAYIPAKITDNPHIEPDYLQSLRDNMLPEDYRKFVDGDWDVYSDSNLFASEFDARYHVSDQAVFNPSRKLIISMDFNLQPFSVCFSHVWQDGAGIHDHTFDEAEIMNGSVPEMADLIKQRYSKYLHNSEITGDFMGRRGDISQRDNASLYVQLIKLLGMSERQLMLPREGNPKHENSKADCNWVLWQSKKPESKMFFKVHPRCKQSIMDFRTVQWDNLKGQIKKRDRTDITQRADFLDAHRYRINVYWRSHVLKFR